MNAVFKKILERSNVRFVSGCVLKLLGLTVLRVERRKDGKHKQLVLVKFQLKFVSCEYIPCDTWHILTLKDFCCLPEIQLLILCFIWECSSSL